MILEPTFSNIAMIKRYMMAIYGKEFMNHSMEWSRYNRMPQSIFGDAMAVFKRRSVDRLLDFKNASGEIVMSEKDNGKLAIHDEVLKESLENKMTLEEAKKRVNKED